MILVDDPIYFWHGKYWCHMVSDTSLDELHTFAASLGLKRAWFQKQGTLPHYDITANKRQEAISKGAVAVDGKRLFVWAIRGSRVSPEQLQRVEGFKAKYPKTW